MRRLVGLLALLVALGAACSTAAPRTLEERAHAIEREVWSPYCPGRLLSDCTTRQARDLREEIERRLRAGHGERAIYQWLQTNYGDEVLARPGTDAAGIALWLVPALVFGIGGVVVAVTVRRWTRTTAARTVD
jgi:cytochrome c-type biogenesis protein CcmH